MTHDELLAKIEKINLVSCDQTIDSPEKIIICGECFVCQALYALRAVVETTQYPPVSNQWQWADGWKCAMLTIIQAIEKELG